jgi:glutathionyl-hydroquinone reductase
MTGLKQVHDAALNMLHIKRHYFGSHPSLNALGIIAAGPPGESSQFSGPTPQHRLTLA